MLVRLSLALLIGLFAQANLDRVVRHIEQGDLAGAEKLLLEQLATEPDSARGRYLLGFIRFRTGRFREAAGSLEEAGRLSPNNADTWKLLGMTYSAAGDFENAAEPFRKACRLSRSDPGVCYYLARNYFVLAQFEPSVKVFRQALKKAPDDWRLHRGLGLSLEALSENEEAERRLRESVRLSDGAAPAEIDPRIDLGAFLYRRGQTEEAIAVLEKALKGHPAHARIHFELARCLAQRQENTSAVQHLEAALRNDPGNWPAHQLLGKLHMRLGNTEEGRRHLEIARQGIVAETYGSRTVR